MRVPIILFVLCFSLLFPSAASARRAAEPVAAASDRPLNLSGTWHYKTWGKITVEQWDREVRIYLTWLPPDAKPKCYPEYRVSSRLEGQRLLGEWVYLPTMEGPFRFEARVGPDGRTIEVVDAEDPLGAGFNGSVYLRGDGPTGGGPEGAEIEEALPPVSGGNNALLFDGANDFVEIPENASIRLGQNDPLTVEFWVYLSSRAHDWIKLFTKWGRGLGEDDEFAICIYQNHTFGFANTGATGVGSNEPLPTDTWCHVAFVWNTGENDYRIYMNGEPVLTNPVNPAALRMTGEPLRIGTDGHHNQWFVGRIDEIRIWNVSRSAEEIERDMNRPLSGNEAGLVGYWNLDEGEGQIVRDRSGNGNNGRLGRLPQEDDSDPGWIASGVSLGYIEIH